MFGKLFVRFARIYNKRNKILYVNKKNVFDTKFKEERKMWNKRNFFCIVMIFFMSGIIF